MIDDVFSPRSVSGDDDLFGRIFELMIVTGETETKTSEKRVPEVHFTSADVPPSCTAPRHQTFRLVHSATAEDVFSYQAKEEQQQQQEKNNNNLLLELFLLPGASFQRRPGIGVMRVRLWDSWEHIIVCPVNWLYFVPSFPELGSTGRKRKAFLPRGDILPLNQTERRREPSDSAEPDVTPAQVQPKGRSGGESGGGGGGNWCTSVSQQTLKKR